MDVSEDIASPESGKCLIVNGKKLCYDPMPDETKKKEKCINISGYYFCENGEKELTIKGELKRSLGILLNPEVETDEASYMELKAIEYTIGFFLGALAFTLSYYIKDIIDYIVYSLIPGSMSILTLFIIILVMTGLAIGLVFIEYRMRKVAVMTRLMEKASKKTAPELIDDLGSPD